VVEIRHNNNLCFFARSRNPQSQLARKVGSPDRFAVAFLTVMQTSHTVRFNR
jgi:hypothetical protein